MRWSTEIVPGARVYVLSGPSFAADVLKAMPTAVTLAAPTLAEAGEWAQALSLPMFRIYGSDDVLGVEIGGALKNVLAIACGIADGRGLGDSARAALTTRGFAELMRFGKKLGAKPETLTGLAGLGRSPAHLLQPPIAQLFLWPGDRAGDFCCRGACCLARRCRRSTYGQGCPFPCCFE